LKRLELFPESGCIEPLLQGMEKEYRAVNYDKLFKIIYTINDDEIIIETLWNMKRNPKSLKKDI
ncbi:MAG: type II toxin-antitoxin system RelE/ParE family toxin, partial [Bacteroidales bacterium]|nr:type II toxin-antitoxin system RelE/ParE family toxin [Bacteroidales bacterium]